MYLLMQGLRYLVQCIGRNYRLKLNLTMNQDSSASLKIVVLSSVAGLFLYNGAVCSDGQYSSTI